MDIGEHIRKAVEQLDRAGCDTPRLDAELLLGHALGLSRAQLIARWDQVPSADQAEAYLALLGRRARREPLAYIVGRKEFFGLEFEVDRSVLIPRPETELLVERAIETARQIDQSGREILRSAQNDAGCRLHIADIGTGSGAIAVSLAVSLREASIYAVDRSAAALATAARNCARHGVEDRVRLLQGDLLAALPEPVDMIVANLPYVGRAELETLAPEIRCFEPAEALDGGADGMDLIRRLLAQVASQAQRPRRGKMPPPQVILLEIGAMQGQAVIELVEEILGGAEVSLTQDYAGFDRIVTVR